MQAETFFWIFSQKDSAKNGKNRQRSSKCTALMSRDTIPLNHTACQMI
jgi:hypothetical protein